MEKMEPLSLVKIDEHANHACKKNNEKILKEEEKIPEIGGNIECLKVILGNAKTPEAEEFTMVQWSGTAHEMILLNLLHDFELTGKPALLEHKTIKVGMSFKAHKKAQNVFQIIYIKSMANIVA